MNQKNNFLLIIPARSGSKRLPAKNKLPLAGKPLISWTIEAALQSTLRQAQGDIIISTDDKEIAKIAEQAGAKVPFMRHAELSTDTATSFDVVKHAIDFYKSKGQEFEFVVLLQPTSPLRTAQDIDNAIEFFQEKNADAVISVCETEYRPQWCNTLPPDLSMEKFTEPSVKNDSKKYFRPNGAIYINRIKQLLEEKTFYIKKNIFAFIMDKTKSVDIDTEADFKRAESHLNKK